MNKAEPAWGLPMQHVLSLRTEEQHIDMFGHVNNAWYVAWAMDCAWGHSNELGLDFAAYEEIGVGCVVREHHYSYFAPALLGDEILVGTSILSNDGKLRLRRGFELRRKSDGQLLVTGETEFVSINMKTGRPQRMPQSFINLYKPADLTN